MMLPTKRARAKTMLRHFKEGYENLREYSKKVHRTELPPFQVLLEMIGMEREKTER